MIQVASREEAIEWVKRCPAGPDDVIEIRRVHEAEDFGPTVASAASASSWNGSALEQVIVAALGRDLIGGHDGRR